MDQDADIVASVSPPAFLRNGQLELFGGEPIADTGPNADQMRALLYDILA